MNKHLSAALIGVSALAILPLGVTSDANAQPMSQVCNAIPCIRDGNNKIVGIPLLVSASRQIKDDWYSISINEGGLLASGTYYYAGPNCTGQVFMNDPGYLPKMAQYDGQAIFTSDTRGGEGFDWQSYSFPAKANRGGECHTYGSNCVGQGKPCHAQFGGPAIKIETVTFSEDFKVR